MQVTPRGEEAGMDGFDALLSLAAVAAFWVALWIVAVLATPEARRRRDGHDRGAGSRA
jgi:hypothetical protein